MTLRPVLFVSALVGTSALALVGTQEPERVNERLMATYQSLAPAGLVTQLDGRPVDIAFSEDGARIWVKDSKGLRLIDDRSWKEIAFTTIQGSASLTGLAVKGESVYVTSAGSVMHEFKWDGKQIVHVRAIELPGPSFGGESFPCGIEISEDGNTAYVCLSRNNTVGVVDLVEGRISEQIPVGIAPYEIALLPGGRAMVTNQGGRIPKIGDKTAKSAGSDTVIDERGVAKTGTVSILDLELGTVRDEFEVGLQPSAMALGPGWIAVANSNSDSVTIFSTDTLKQIGHFVIKPDLALPFGSMPNGMSVSPNGNLLLVSLAGNNALAVVDLRSILEPKVLGFVPTGWYPGAVKIRGGWVYVANIKGVGSRTERREQEKGRNSHDQSGSIQKFVVPTGTAMAIQTEQVHKLGRIPQTLAALERSGRSDKRPVPVPFELGDPSTIEHVVYIIKENRTYDQLFGDIEKGSGDPNLCVFPRNVTPNHHALAEEFALLDNYYCEGVLSADGHSWATEGNVTPYLERAFGGFSRSYTFGDDPITYSSTGFIWDYILGAGLSFRNFGEMDDAQLPNEANGWKVDSIWRNYAKGQDVTFVQDIEIENLRRYSSPDYPGWNMGIPDVLRADRFLKEFKEMEASGAMPNLTIIYLPQDHGAGTTPGYPTPASYVADNDLALGRIVDAISHSRFWPKTAIFVNEDDPQAGFDHVDGHRSICLVVSPWTRKGAVVSDFYNQNSVLHTILRIFGLPPMNQQNGSAPIMFSCFSSAPDFSSYNVLDPQIDLDAVNPPLSALTGEARRWAEISMKIPMWRPGLKSDVDDDNLNRIIWHAMKGYDVPYPTEWAGFHGRGLKQRGLKFED